jgi:hypothetical protein
MIEDFEMIEIVSSEWIRFQMPLVKYSADTDGFSGIHLFSKIIT